MFMCIRGKKSVANRVQEKKEKLSRDSAPGVKSRRSKTEEESRRRCLGGGDAGEESIACTTELLKVLSWRAASHSDATERRCGVPRATRFKFKRQK